MIRVLVFLAGLVLVAPALALEPGQVALVINRNVAKSRRLAEYYARQRHIPDGRIIALDLPAQDPLPYDQYDHQVVQTIQAFLKEHALDREVSCLVTFYGVPLKIAGRSNRPAADSTAAFDNELALLWWPRYSRHSWQINPLNLHVPAAHTPPVLMVSRLDGPSEATVKSIIKTSIQVEEHGLKGQIVIDAGGAWKLDHDHKNDAYWKYERTLTNLADLLRARTQLTVLLDVKPELIAPGTAKDVALYCGWYSLRKYVPSCHFSPGAVAFHVASAELVDLHARRESGWCRNLLKDGAVGTLGPVDEPYLGAFPRADEFFPLLLTGRLTLAETYWLTTTRTSWRVALVGDPLDNPYRSFPGIAVADLPEALRQAIER